VNLEESGLAGLGQPSAAALIPHAAVAFNSCDAVVYRVKAQAVAHVRPERLNPFRENRVVQHPHDEPLAGWDLLPPAGRAQDRDASLSDIVLRQQIPDGALRNGGNPLPALGKRSGPQYRWIRHNSSESDKKWDGKRETCRSAPFGLAIVANIRSGFSVSFSPAPLLLFLANYGKIPLPANGNNFQLSFSERHGT
jgi:hypothetical protein